MAGRRLRKYRYARRLIIEAGRQMMPPRLFWACSGPVLASRCVSVQHQLTAVAGYQLADIVGYLLADAVGYQLADIVRYQLVDAVGFGLRILWQVTPAPAARRLAGPGTERAASIIAAVNASVMAMSTARIRITSWKSCVSII